PSAVIAAPSLPADHCEMAVRRGLTAPCARAKAGSASAAADPASRRRLVVVIGMAVPPGCEVLLRRFGADVGVREPHAALSFVRRPPSMRRACHQISPGR